MHAHSKVPLTGRYYACEHVSVLLVVSTELSAPTDLPDLILLVLYVNEPFAVGISKVTAMRWPRMDRLFGEGILDLDNELVC